MQNPLFPPRSDWVAPDILPDLSSASRIAVDLETKDPNLRVSGPGWATGNGHVTGIAIATDGWSGYLPIRHEGGGNLDAGFVLDGSINPCLLTVTKYFTMHCTMLVGCEEKV
jgi:hypothetical protein